MVKKSRGSSGQQRQQGVAKSSEGNDVTVSSGSPSIAVTEQKEGDAGNANGRNRINSKSNGGLVAEAVGKRLRILRKKLQRAEANEKKSATGEQINSEQQTLVASIPALRTVVKELEEISKAGLDNKSDGNRDTESSAETAEEKICFAEERGRAEATVREDMVHHQTLRLIYAVNEKLDRVSEKCVSSIEKAQLTVFYNLVLSSVDFGAAIDEKISQPPLVAIGHLRMLAECSGCSIETKGNVSYADVARIIDKVIVGSADPAASAGSAGEWLVSGSKECAGVKMPKLESMFIHTEETDAQDSDNDFNLQIEVPPGGFSFIAGAEALADSESDQGASESGFKNSAALAESQESMDMPKPVHAQESNTEHDSHVGGFVEPLKHPLAATEPEPEPAQSNYEGKAVPVTSTAQSIMMPVPADNGTANVIEAGTMPGGFAPYLESSQVTNMATWAAASVPSTTSIYGGVVPMPFPPHIAMQYGYVPPQMYGMQPMRPIAGVVGGPPGIGDNSDVVGNPKAGATSAKDTDGLKQNVAEQQQALSSHQPIGVVVPGIEANVLPESMWIPAVSVPGHHHHHQHHHGGSEHGSRVGTQTPVVVAGAGGLQGIPATPPPPLAGTYQHPAMAAPGYPMTTPFMYPHVDASNLSTAATGGGSENNDSVNSADTASNRGSGGGVSSRPNSMHYLQVTPDGQRGFVQAMGMAEYPQNAPYIWPQQQAELHHHQHPHHGHNQHLSYAKNIQTAVYSGYP
ncbi:hypothetical protein LPJ57_001579, partial [Coemansia sp. RSA 486]